MEAIERIDNLIRVLKGVDPDKFNLDFWWSEPENCGCAIGHALRDEYFIQSSLQRSMASAASFFGISSERAVSLFTSGGYIPGGCARHHVEPSEVIARFRVLKLEKLATGDVTDPELLEEIRDFEDAAA